jgi:ParB family transcriptional regulator, chromosome partitioning protein
LKNQALFSRHITDKEVERMAKNEPNKPDEIKTVPEKEAPAKEQTVPIEAAEIADNAPAPETSTGEAATLAQKDEAASKEMGEAKAGPPSPVSGEHIPTPGDIVVSFEKINEIVSEKQVAKDAEKSGSTDKKAQPDKTGSKPRTPGRKGKNRFEKSSRKISLKPAEARPPKKWIRSLPALSSRKKHRKL